MLSLFLAAALSVPATPDETIQATEPGSVEVFGDWAVGCDNGGICEAVSLYGEEDLGSYGGQMRIRRFGTDGADYQIVIEMSESYDGEQYDGPVLKLRHGYEGPVIAQAERSAITNANQPRRFDLTQDQRSEVITYANPRGTLSMHRQDGAGIGHIQLNGLREALNYIDQQQERGIYMRDASADTGDLPLVIGTPVAARFDAEVDVLTGEEALRLHEEAECDGGRDATRRNDAFPLSDVSDLILISCSGGAYNFTDIVFVRQNDEIIRPHFDRNSSATGNELGPYIVNAQWDADRHELAAGMRGRGLGDCGARERFVWDGEMFRLVHREIMPVCRGSQRFITTYRANVRWIEP